MNIKLKAKEFWYWHAGRKLRRFTPWLARKLPKNLKYFVVVHGMVTVEPNLSPEKVTGMQMLDLWSPERAA